MRKCGWLGLLVGAAFMALSCSGGGGDDDDNGPAPVTAGSGIWVANKGAGNVLKFAFNGTLMGTVPGFE